MIGINATLDIAKQAIQANQYGLNVTGQNIANVDNPNYSRQLMELNSGGSLKVGGLVFGTGVDVTQIASSVDSLLQSWMNNEQSTASAYDKKSGNLNYVQDIFNLDTDSSLDSLFSDFWNSWSKLSNVPDGSSERAGVLESGNAIVQQFNDMSDGLNNLSSDVNNRIDVAVDSINGITAQIDKLNKSIVSIEAQQGAVANDLRDERTALVSKLSGLLDITTYEQSDGSLLVTAARGSAILVGSGGTRELSTGDGGRIMWESSGGPVDISDQISGGSLGGWLDIRDEVIPEYQSELDSLARAFMWNVNYQHSQGVGLNYFSDAVTGSSATDASAGNQLDSLDFFNNVDPSGTFSTWIHDSSTDTNTKVGIDFSSYGIGASSTMQDLADAFNQALTDQGATGVTATVNADGDQIIFTPDSSNYQFAFGEDDSGLAAALGVNTFFTGSGADDMGINSQLSDTDNIAAGQLDPTTGEIAAGDNSNALLLAECGEISMDMNVYSYDRTSDPPSTASTITTTTDSYYQTMVSNLGVLTDNVNRNLETSQAMVSELQDQRDSISGVSLDEEMINLTKYQNSYNAASKLLKVADEMLDTIISTR